MNGYRLGGILLQPYRPFFLAGSLYAVVAVAFWFFWIHGLFRGRPLAIGWTVEPIAAHAFTMIWGVLTCYVFGFLLTAYVRWVAAPPPSRKAVSLWLLLLVVGHTLFAAGALGFRSLLIPGAAAVGVALASFMLYLALALRRSGETVTPQPAIVLTALGFGIVGLIITAVGMTNRVQAIYNAGILTGIYGYVLLLIASVGGRIIPFFIARARGTPPSTRRETLPLLLLLIVLRIALGSLAQDGVSPRIPPLIDAALLIVLGREVAVWRPGPALRNPMIGILYLALAWVLVALAGSATTFFFQALPTPIFHTIAIGGFVTMVMGISTRVGLAHAGRPPFADRWILLAFGLIQVALLLRVGLWLGGALLPTLRLYSHWAALPWCLAFLVWLGRIGPLLFADDPQPKPPLPVR